MNTQELVYDVVDESGRHHYEADREHAYQALSDGAVYAVEVDLGALIGRSS